MSVHLSPPTVPDNPTHIVLEIAAGSVAAALAAQEGGADRVELCANLLEGGTTPSFATIALAREKLHIPLYPIIRPRGGDFFYDELDFELMKKDIALCKQLQCDGIVLGLLTAEGKVDKIRCSALITLAWPMGVTFHRAFDMTDDPFAALEDLIEMGCERVLTSGQKNTASEGAALIAQLVAAADERICIMAGSGVRADNIADLIKQTRAKAYHSSARIYTDSAMQFRNPHVSMGGIPGIPEYGIAQVDIEQVRLLRQKADEAMQALA